MSVSLDDLVDRLVKTAPAGELNEVKQDLMTIVPGNKSTILNSMENYIQEQAIGTSDGLLASKLNKDPHSTKYIDYIGKQKFNFDLETNRAIDLEQYSPTVDYPSYFDDLVDALQRYGEDHYPSDYAFTVVPQLQGGVKVIIVGQKINKQNFYTGRWKSVYSVDSTGHLEGQVGLNIHYYEDGNVRLSLEESTEDTSLSGVSASSIVNAIRTAENNLTLKIINDFTSLNQKYFKNLRRLLPVTKSKINWGKAIGTYRLGSDVVNK